MYIDSNQASIVSNNIFSSQNMDNAAAFIDRIINSINPADEIRNYLDDFEKLLPAMIDLNINQAKADSRYDLVDALDKVKHDLGLGIQKDPELLNYDIQSGHVVEGIEDATDCNKYQILVLVPDPNDIATRIENVIFSLRELGWEVCVQSGFNCDCEILPDLVIAPTPHVNPMIMSSLALIAAKNIPIILDLDIDYERMPIKHPFYQTMGLGNRDNAKNYLAALMLASKVTVPSSDLQKRLSLMGYDSAVMAESWRCDNELWLKEIPRRDSINIGWLGSVGDIGDLLKIRRIIVRVMREFPDIQLVIGCNQDAYHIFESIPENRKTFLPSVSRDDYPYLYSQFDILLVPMDNTPFNRTVSDKMLVEAGVKNIPWIASEMPEFVQWHVGGLFANSLEDWHTCMRQLILDQSLRRSLGEAGHKKAISRSHSNIKDQWKKTIIAAIAH